MKISDLTPRTVEFIPGDLPSAPVRRGAPFIARRGSGAKLTGQMAGRPAPWPMVLPHLRLRQQQRQAHSLLDNKTPVETRWTLELLDGNAPGALAQPETDNYQHQGLSV